MSGARWFYTQALIILIIYILMTYNKTPSRCTAHIAQLHPGRTRISTVCINVYTLIVWHVHDIGIESTQCTWDHGPAPAIGLYATLPLSSSIGLCMYILSIYPS
ncbi:hypothetical protein C8R48DRAFT_112752 [Suillus tomentosus]|nr:hypothetical protein C8R48DRAFT_112752 [Suillus tomentosus]